MATSINPVVFDFGEGKNRELKFTLASIRQFKTNWGKPLWRVRLAGPGEMMPEMAVDHVCMTFVMQAALLTDEPDITFETTENLMQSYVTAGGDIQKIGNALGEAFNSSGLFGERKTAAEIAKAEASGGKDPNEKRDPSLN